MKRVLCMPNTVIEAQATGLPCLISDNITKEANVSGLVYFKSLDLGPSEWAKQVMCLNEENRPRYCAVMAGNGYGINETTEEFVRYIF